MNRNLIKFGTLALLICATVSAIISCQKTGSSEIKDAPTPKYDLNAVAEFRLLQAGRIQRDWKETNRLVNNYLAFQADSLVNAGKKKVTSSENVKVTVITEDVLTTTKPISNLFSVTNSSGNTILVQLVIGQDQTIKSMSYSVGGLHGDIAQTGEIEQTKSNGVNTFKFYLSGTFSNPQTGTLQYTNQCIVYGNVYQNQLSGGAILNWSTAPPRAGL